MLHFDTMCTIAKKQKFANKTSWFPHYVYKPIKLIYFYIFQFEHGNGGPR